MKERTKTIAVAISLVLSCTAFVLVFAFRGGSQQFLIALSAFAVAVAFVAGGAVLGQLSADAEQRKRQILSIKFRLLCGSLTVAFAALFFALRKKESIEQYLLRDLSRMEEALDSMSTHTNEKVIALYKAACKTTEDREAYRNGLVSEGDDTADLIISLLQYEESHGYPDKLFTHDILLALKQITNIDVAAFGALPNLDLRRLTQEVERWKSRKTAASKESPQHKDQK